MKNKLLLPILLSFTTLLLMNQNCAQSGFSAMDGSMVSDQSSSLGSSIAQERSNPSFNLMSANQVYQTFLSLTGQEVETDRQRDEFNSRRGSFSDQGEVQAINAPYLLAATSLAGTSCAELIAREVRAPANERVYFQGINFLGGVTSIPDAEFVNSSQRLASNFWKTSLDNSEIQTLLQFKYEFTQGVPVDNAAENLRLWLGVCSALLSNVRVISL